MKVRHVTAKPNEYIAVHRSYPRNNKNRHNVGKRNTASQTPVWAIVIAVILLVIYWKLIFSIALIAGGLYLVYVFRKPLAALLIHIWEKIKS